MPHLFCCLSIIRTVTRTMGPRDPFRILEGGHKLMAWCLHVEVMAAASIDWKTLLFLNSYFLGSKQEPHPMGGRWRQWSLWL